MRMRTAMGLTAMWAVGCAAQAATGGEDFELEGGGGPAPADMTTWGAAGGAADPPVLDPQPSDATDPMESPTPSSGSPTPSSASSAASNESPDASATPDTAEPSTETSQASSPSTSTPPLFPPPDPDRTPSPDNIAECPDEAPADPWGPCLGVPVYAVCNYGTTYSCLCDWIHWICVG